MTTYRIQLQHTSSQSSAGDFTAVAKVLQAITVTAEPRACYGTETADALDAIGPRRRAIMAALNDDPDGRYVLAKLPVDGVVWAHPRSVALMDGLIAATVMTADDKAALVQLSAPTTQPHVDVTAEQCECDWIVGQAQEAHGALAARANNVGGWLASIPEGLTVDQLRAFCGDVLSSEDGNPTVESV